MHILHTTIKFQMISNSFLKSQPLQSKQYWLFNGVEIKFRITLTGKNNAFLIINLFKFSYFIHELLTFL